jgi:hypothetical protein
LHVDDAQTFSLQTQCWGNVFGVELMGLCGLVEGFSNRYRIGALNIHTRSQA